MPGGFYAFATNLDGYEASIPLRTDFRFLHEPASAETVSRRFAGRNEDLEELVTRLLFSHGGAFLVTGYRGVGKTSFVNQVIRRLTDLLDPIRRSPESLQKCFVHSPLRCG